MIALRKIKLKEAVFIDIETAPVVPKLEIDTELFNSWEYKKKRDNLSNEELIKTYSLEASLYAEFAKIVCISVGRVNKNKLVVRTYNNENEEKLLEKFNTDLTKVTDNNPKTFFCGHSVISFDIPFIFKRCIVNKIIPHELLDTAHLKFWEVSTVDINNLWKGTSFTSSSLTNIAVALGLPFLKDDISGADVGNLFWSKDKNKIDKISQYCEKDVLTTANIVRRCRFEPLLEIDTNNEEISVENNKIVQYLFNGGRYTDRCKKELSNFLQSLSDEEKTKAFVILESIVSNASGKRTKFTKAHIKNLKKEI